MLGCILQQPLARTRRPWQPANRVNLLSQFECEQFSRSYNAAAFPFRPIDRSKNCNNDPLAHDQDGTGSMLDDFFSAAEQEMFPSGIAMGRYHQEISRQVGSNSNDFIARMKCAALCRANLLIL